MGKILDVDAVGGLRLGDLRLGDGLVNASLHLVPAVHHRDAACVFALLVGRRLHVAQRQHPQRRAGAYALGERLGALERILDLVVLQHRAHEVVAARRDRARMHRVIASQHHDGSASARQGAQSDQGVAVVAPLAALVKRGVGVEEDGIDARLAGGVEFTAPLEPLAHQPASPLRQVPRAAIGADLRALRQERKGRAIECIRIDHRLVGRVTEQALGDDRQRARHRAAATALALVGRRVFVEPSAVAVGVIGSRMSAAHQADHRRVDDLVGHLQVIFGLLRLGTPRDREEKAAQVVGTLHLAGEHGTHHAVCTEIHAGSIRRPQEEVRAQAVLDSRLVQH